jgi:hypothetical protein
MERKTQQTGATMTNQPKFNVHHWDGMKWTFVAIATAPNEDEAAQLVALRFHLKGRFASYPHIDYEEVAPTAKTPFTDIR